MCVACGGVLHLSSQLVVSVVSLLLLHDVAFASESWPAVSWYKRISMSVRE